MGKKPIVSVTYYENERISIKNSLPYLKCELHLSCVVHGQIYGSVMSLAWVALGKFLREFVYLAVEICHR